jgi:heme-degrading monooxygenase HmoA
MIDMRANFVAVSIYTVTTEKLAALGEAARATIAHDLASLDGFYEGIVMANEAQTQVLIVTLWDSKEAWARAEWEPRVGKAVAAFVTDATHFTELTFTPIAVVHKAP